MQNLPINQTSMDSEIGFAGSSSYHIQGDRILIQLDEIHNHRDQGDISGTLSIELWALSQPYNGGSFDGIALAGTRIGELLDRHYLSNCRYDLLFQEPPAGTWHLVLMLREWTGNGFETRDQINFALPYQVSERPAVARSESGKVISIDFNGGGKAELPAESEMPKPAKQPTAKTVAEKPAAKAAKPESKAAKSTVAKHVAEEAAAPAAKLNKGKAAAVTADDRPKAAKVADQHQQDNKISLNHAKVSELARTKGLSKELAHAIVEARPFKDIEGLLRIKGIGKNTLKKLKDLVRL